MQIGTRSSRPTFPFCSLGPYGLDNPYAWVSDSVTCITCLELRLQSKMQNKTHQVHTLDPHLFLEWETLLDWRARPPSHCARIVQHTNDFSCPRSNVNGLERTHDLLGKNLDHSCTWWIVHGLCSFLCTNPNLYQCALLSCVVHVHSISKACTCMYMWDAGDSCVLAEIVQKHSSLFRTTSNNIMCSPYKTH